MAFSYIAIGSNLGDRLENIKKSISLISEKNKIIKVSNFYITKPMYYLNQPYFVNCVIKIKTNLKPYELLNLLLNIELKLGRKRVFKNHPRTIDLDILYYDDLVINTTQLKLPHPLIHERLFVLKPMGDISLDFFDPMRKKRIIDMMNKFSDDILKVPSNYKECIDFLMSLKPYKKKDITVSFIKDTLNVLKNPQNKLKNVIHITGSCGKTSTAKYINDILTKLGFKTVLYSSPHILDIRERICYCNKKISEKDFLKNLISIISLSKHIHSVFEYLTLIAIIYFSERKHDFSIIEVGMGGLNDATNIFNKSISVFTTITTEHKNWLGKTLKEITINKSGIIKKNSLTFISGFNRKSTIKIISKIAMQKNNKVYVYQSSNIDDINKFNFMYSSFIVSKITKRAIDLNFSPPFARNSELSFKDRKILFDGAHTPISMKILLRFIKKMDYKICLLSFMKDKNYNRMLELVIKSNIFEKIIVTSSYSYRTINPLSIKTKKVTIIKDIKKALDYVLSLNKNFVVTGSLYFCSDIYNLLTNRLHNEHLPELK